MKVKLMYLMILLIVFSVFSSAQADTQILRITWGRSKLVTFDPYSGSITQFHVQLNPDESFRGLTYDSTNDILYALSQVDHNLYSIDPHTLNIQFIGRLSYYGSNSWEGDSAALAYDPNTDTLYTSISHNHWPPGRDDLWSELVIINRETAELTSVGHITNGYVNSTTYNRDDGFIYAYAVYGSGSWDSPYKSSLVKINPNDASMNTLFETPYHATLGLAKIPNQNVFISWVNWTSHFYGEVNLDSQIITPLGNSDSVGVSSDAMLYKSFYVSPVSIWRVDGQNGIDPVDCTGGDSWPTAFKTVGKVVECSDAVDQIWVKKGTYSLSETINVDKAVRIYGGFDGTEVELSQRSLQAKSIVDGQDSVRCFTVDADATIDGFKIVNGYTTQGGGGMSIGLSAATVSNCIFSENQAGWGGGLNNYKSSSTISNCIFDGNSANNGAGIYNRESSPNIINSTFSNNSANSGGAITNYLQPSATITNCILWGDTASTGPEIYNYSSNPTVKYSDIDQWGYAGSNGNIREDPLFHMNYIVGDVVVVEQINTFRLRSDSPCIDAGTSQNAPLYDIDGDPRPWGRALT